jgi:putative Mg2+ transporter-C (MgtC) family protein
MFPLQLDSVQINSLLTVGIAMVLGALIGLDREFQDKPAGLRTHMLVAGAAALLVTLGDLVIQDYASDVGGDLVRTDPIRIVQAVITGVTFLGAGTIIRSGSGRRVEGLTTAASILFAAAVGISVALSHYLLAGGATILVLVTLRGVQVLERWILDRAK